MSETLIDMLEEIFPEEDCAIFDEGPKGRLLGMKVPEEQRLLIHVHRVGHYYESENFDIDMGTGAAFSYSRLEDFSNVISLISDRGEKRVILDIDQREHL